MKNYTVTVNGNVYEVSVEESTAEGGTVKPIVQKPVAPLKPTQPRQAAPPSKAGNEGSIKVNSPMPGKILGIKVKMGQAVKKGEVLLLLEAMKMENEIVSPQDAVVASIPRSAGDVVESGDLLVTLN